MQQWLPDAHLAAPIIIVVMPVHLLRYVFSFHVIDSTLLTNTVRIMAITPLPSEERDSRLQADIVHVAREFYQRVGGAGAIIPLSGDACLHDRSIANILRASRIRQSGKGLLRRRGCWGATGNHEGKRRASKAVH